jgi:uncharacterized protein YqhQ
MTALLLILFIVSVLIFFILRSKSIRARIIWSALFFVVSAGSSIAYILIIGDKPSKDAIEIPGEALKKEGMTREEWNEYAKGQKKQ